MSYPGEYPQPLVRVTNVMCPVISGYATSRLRRQDPLFGSGNVGVHEDNAQAQVTFHNVGSSTFSVQLKSTTELDPPGVSNDTGAATGTRYLVGAAVSLVPGGVKTVNVVPYQDFLEVYGTSGNGSLRMQISSKVRWDEMAFDKSDTLYAQVLNNMVPVPQAPTI